MFGDKAHRFVNIVRFERPHDRRVGPGDIKKIGLDSVAQCHDLMDAQIKAVPRRKQQIVVSNLDQSAVECLVRRRKLVLITRVRCPIHFMTMGP